MTEPAALDKIHRLQGTYHDGLVVPDPPRILKVVRLLKRRSPGTLLDVGYSKGSFSDYLAEAGWECTGLDVNVHQNPKVRTLQCDLNEPFPVVSESFDAVTAGEVIEHMVDEGAFLEECRRVLKPGGILALTTPNLGFLANRLLVLFGRMPMFVYAPYHYHFHVRRTLVELVGQHGFDVEDVRSSHVLYSSRRHPTGRIFEWLGDIFPSLGAHLIVMAKKR